MKQNYLYAGLFSAMSIACQPVHAQTATLYFDYVATNADSGKGGDIAAGTGGKYTDAATVTITDLSDLGVSGGASADGKQTYSNGGVRVVVTNTHTTDIFGKDASAATVIGSFLLNFPNTNATATDFNNNYVNWGNNSGIPIAFSSNPDDGGVEWQEEGCATTAISGACSAPENSGRAKWEEWGQEYNYGGTNGTNVDKNNRVIAFTQGQSSTFDIYNAANASDISVLKLLGKPVESTGLPHAFGWIKVSGIPNSANPNNRAVAASGWWGNSVNSSVTTSTNNRIQLLATHYSLNGGAVTSALPSNTAASPTECLFNAFENDPVTAPYLQPKGFSTSVFQQYTYRYYSKSNAYLGVSSADNHLYYLDASGKLWDLTQTFGWTVQGKLAEYRCQ